MSGVPILEELRPRAFAVAYRMLGSVSEAEDIVQEALLRLHLTLQQGERIESPRAYLSTVVTGEDNTRQLVARARRHVDEGRLRFEASQERREQLARSFLAAVDNGDLQALEALLAHDVVLHGDGGGRVRAITRPVHGRAKVARVLLSWMHAAEPFGGWSLRQVQVNGQPGVLVSDVACKLIAVAVLDIAHGHIQAVRSIVNPDKLRHLDQEATA
jgi:hypothetical protein